ncbi:transcription initiation factor IID, 31kD subunit-domain-containing protein [Mycena sp. CBHHK59/15]|nr:transcription initiation factor IID, 31kD subunit-domain-containing protein [Mycena sp. CBHHK59/15]
MSRPDNLPPTARAIALLLSSTPSIQDVQPGVLHQLLEFSHRYTAHVLTDANVYAEYAGRSGKIEMDDVVLAVQARVGWEFGGRVPKEYILSLASEVNAVALPAVPEVFGVRMPPSSDCLTSIDFDLIPNKPPPSVKLYDEEIEEVEESESDEDDDDEDMEPADAGEEEDGLFAGGDEEEEDSDGMEEVQTSLAHTNGVKRKLEEDDDYD